MTNTDYLTERLRPGAERFTEPQLSASEARLGQVYPPSFRALLLAHGRFGLHRADDSENIVFEVWPLDEHQTALSRAAGELECEATADAVGEALGLAPEMVAALEQIVLVGCEHDEDFVGFDLRTRHPDTKEAPFVLQLMDDTEIEYLSEHPEPLEPRTTGFDGYLKAHVRRNK